MADTAEQPTPETAPTTNEVSTEEKKEEVVTEETKEEEVPPTVTEEQQQQEPHEDEVEAVQVEVNTCTCISKDLFSFFVSYHDQQQHNV